MTHSWLDLVRSPIETVEMRNAIVDRLPALKAPATRSFVMGRVATMLNHYYVSPIGEQAMTAIAQDWAHHLQGFPRWAIEAACLWWMGSENPDRRKKPVPGDIASRAKHEVAILRLAEGAVGRFDRATEAMK